MVSDEDDYLTRAQRALVSVMEEPSGGRNYGSHGRAMHYAAKARPRSRWVDAHPNSIDARNGIAGRFVTDWLTPPSYTRIDLPLDVETQVRHAFLAGGGFKIETPTGRPASGSTDEDRASKQLEHATSMTRSELRLVFRYPGGAIYNAAIAAIVAMPTKHVPTLARVLNVSRSKLYALMKEHRDDVYIFGQNPTKGGDLVTKEEATYIFGRMLASEQVARAQQQWIEERKALEVADIHSGFDSLLAEETAESEN